MSRPNTTKDRTRLFLIILATTVVHVVTGSGGVVDSSFGGGSGRGGRHRQLATVSTTDILARYPGQDDYISPTEAVRTVVGGLADLPCNLTSPVRGDPALLVLWYKSGVHKPIYSYDRRAGPATHWKNPSYLGARAAFDPSAAALVIQGVHEEDEGTYRCRVDFRTNPTLTFITNLTVIVPPRRLTVYTELGVEARSIVGPFIEGDPLRLTCQANGGSPPPKVSWWEGSLLLDVTQEREEAERVSNTLLVPELSRRDLHRTLTCQASNTNLTAPLATTVTLDIDFPPMWVRQLSSRDPLSAGRNYEVVCQAAGARPPAVITWWLGNERLTSHTDKTSHEGNVTTSTLRWTPEVKDANKVLSCHAQSPTVKSPPLRNDWLLDIYYEPTATLHPGGSLNLSNIEEKDDVYFECRISANPRVYKIVWLHEDQELQHNVTAGIIISNQSLVLQSVARTASGNYYCVASNIEGDGRSNPILLKVKYSPVCQTEQLMYHGAAKHEEVKIPCSLDAYPPPLYFRWTFNNSGESVQISQTHIDVSGSLSTVSYTPNTELDYGTLLCWGTNAVGRQRTPCVFHVFPAGHPDPVHNCSVYNLSVSVVNVRCVAGFDGGLPQTFIMELYDPHSDLLLANISSLVPSFSVGGLPPAEVFTGIVYSINKKGRSEMVSLQVFTLKDVAERHTAAVKPLSTKGKSTVRFLLTPMVAVGLGVIGGLLAVAIIICIVIRVRYGRRPAAGGVVGRGDRLHTHTIGGGGQESDPGVGGQSKGVDKPLKEVNIPPESPKDGDEKNPDVIPQSDCNTWVVAGVNTISSLPNTCVTIPRAAHLYAKNTYQPSGGVDVQYAELLLSEVANAPTQSQAQSQQQQQQQQQQQVVYATLDHNLLSHRQKPSETVAPTSLLQQQHPGSSSTPPPSLPHQQQPLLQQHNSHYTAKAPSGRAHHLVLSRDPHLSDPEAVVPLMANQRESSV